VGGGDVYAVCFLHTLLFDYVAGIAGTIINDYIFHEPMNAIMVMGLLLTSAGLFAQCFVS
jgi:hypothetical protein